MWPYSHAIMLPVDAPSSMLHHAIWKHYQSPSKAHAQVLKVRWAPAFHLASLLRSDELPDGP